MYESAFYLTAASVGTALAAVIQIPKDDARRNVALTAFSLIMATRGILLYIFFNTDPSSSLHAISRALDYFLMAPILPLGLEMLRANIASRVIPVNRILTRLAYVVPFLTLCTSGFLVILYDIETIRVFTLIFGAGTLVLLFLTYAALLITNPFKFEKPEYSRGARLLFLGYSVLFLAEAILAGVFRAIDHALVFEAMGVIVVGAGCAVMGTTTFGGIYTRLNIGFALVYKDSNVEVTNLGGKLVERSSGKENLKVAEVVVANVGQEIDRVFETGLEMTIPYMRFDVLDPTRVYQVDIIPHQFSRRGNPFSLFVIVTDVTAVVYESETEQLAGLLDDVLGERNRAEFYLDLLSHDIANLLQGILLGIEMSIDDEQISERTSQNLILAREQIDKSVALIRDVKVLAEAQTSEPKTEVLSVKNELLKAISLAKTKFPSDDLVFDLEIEKDLPHIQGESELIESFVNIIRHCIWTQSNESPRIKIRAYFEKRKKGNVVVEISAFGNGIPDDLKPTIFDWETRSNMPSAGVGLPIAKTLLNRSNAQIEVKDRIDGNYQDGPRFVITFSDVTNEDI